MRLHRNSQKRIFIEDGGIPACRQAGFVTSKTLNNYSHFKESIFCDLFTENLYLCKKLKQFYLYAWVLMYDHFHLLIRPGEEFGLSEVMHFLKRHISRDINLITQSIEGDIRKCRLRGGVYECYQSVINNYDEKIKIFKSQFLKKYPTNPYPQTCLPAGRFKFQKSYHDHYIQNNPVQWGYDRNNLSIF